MNEITAPREKSIVVHLKDKELVDQLRDRARKGILAWLRDADQRVFWHNSVSETLGFFPLARFLGIKRSENLNLQSVAKVLAHQSPFVFRTFEATWSGGDGSYPRVQACLTGNSEWTDVLNEAWEGLERPPHDLSESASMLLKWLQDQKNHNAWIHRSTIGRQAQLRGTSWTAEFLLGLFKEIQRKKNIGLKFEQKDEEFRVSLQKPNPPKQIEKLHGPINPVLTVDFKKVEFSELELFRNTLYDWILAANLPSDGTQLLVWHIQDRATLFRCFPLWTKENWEISTLVNFLSQVALEHGLLWGYSFQHPDPWTYVCVPKDGLTWSDVATSIQKTRALPPLNERYGISVESAALVKWFTTLRNKEWLGNLTPPLEENLKHRIGITTNWNEKNLAVYFSMLADEISDRTEWKVTVHPWNGGWGNPTHRLLVKRKPGAVEEVVKQIQILGITEGKVLPKDQVENALLSLLDRPKQF